MKKKKSYWTRLLKIVRQEWARNNPDRKECFLRAKLIPFNGLQKWECAKCEYAFALSEVQCDHIHPIGNTTPQTYEEFLGCLQRLHSSELQILCRGCHRLKTKQDMHDKKYTEALMNVSCYLQMFPAFIMRQLTDFKVLQKFDNTIKKIKVYEQNQKYIRKLDKLKEKYL
jgi:5-methylcytosine-specific restriction endonuclease McrA